MLAQPSSDRLVENAPPALEPDQPMKFEVPAVVGTYGVDRAVRVGDNVYVYVKSGSSGGAFLVAAGFAYLPAGPTRTLDPVGAEAERVRFRHVDGDWYAWTASW